MDWLRRKKKKKSDHGFNIGTGVMPPAALAAVPRSPPHPQHHNQTLTHQESIDQLTSETDTSLPDYEQAKGDSSYSMVRYPGLGRSAEKTPDWDNRNPLPTPPPEFADPEIDDAGQGYSLARDLPMDDEPLYSVPNKSKRRSKLSESSESPIRAEVASTSYGIPSADTMGHTYSSQIPTGGTHKRTPSPYRRDKIEHAIVEQHTSATGSAPPYPSLQSTLHTAHTDELKSSGSTKLQSLRRQSSQLLEGQLTMKQRLEEQNQKQIQLLERLEQQLQQTQRHPEQTSIEDVNSLVLETQNVVGRTTKQQKKLVRSLEKRIGFVEREKEQLEQLNEQLQSQGATDQSLKQQQELLKSLQNRTDVLELEKQELQDINDQLQAEINSFHRLASFRDNDDPGAGTQTHLLKKQLQDYRDECDTLKASVYKLNAELSRYQAKYRSLTPAETEEVPGLPVRGPKPSWLVNTKYLAPLLVAYDDQLEAKDKIIKQYENAAENFKARIQEVIKENQRLHVRLEHSDTAGPVSMTEWRQLQGQCKLVLEENQLLMEQLNVQENKSSSMQQTHMQEVAKLSKKYICAEAEKNQLEQELEEIRQKFADMKREHDMVVIENKAKVGVEEHMTAVNDLKRHLEDGKSIHAREIENIMTKLQSISSERKTLSMQVEELKSENKQMEAEMRAMQKAHRKSLKKIQLMQVALDESAAKQESAEKYLTTMLKVAEKTVMERDTFAQAAKQNQLQKDAAINKITEGSIEVGRLEEKMKACQLKASDKLEKAAVRLKQQDEDFNKQRQEYEREFKHLRLLIRERDELLDSVAGEKRQVEDDLETMWQVASADNRRMRDTLRKRDLMTLDYENEADEGRIQEDKRILIDSET